MHNNCANKHYEKKKKKMRDKVYMTNWQRKN